MPYWLSWLGDVIMDPDNRTVIAGLCGGIVAVASAAWLFFTSLVRAKGGTGAVAVRETAIERLARWVFFGVLVSLVPLIWSYVNLLLKDQPATVAKVVGNGELLLIVSAMCAGALGEFYGRTEKYKLFKLCSGGCTTIVLIFSTLLFASVAEARFVGPKLDEAFLVSTSLFLLGCGFISCTCCVALSNTP